MQENVVSMEAEGNVPRAPPTSAPHKQYHKPAQNPNVEQPPTPQRADEAKRQPKKSTSFNKVKPSHPPAQPIPMNPASLRPHATSNPQGVVVNTPSASAKTATGEVCCWRHSTMAAAGLRPPHTIDMLVRTYPGGAILVSGAVQVTDPVDFGHFAPTQALDSLSTGKPAEGVSTLKVSVLKLCRAHSAGKCKLGSACRNIHLCAQIALSPTASSRRGMKLPPIQSDGTPPVEPLSTPSISDISRQATEELPQRSTSPVPSARTARGPRGSSPPPDQRVQSARPSRRQQQRQRRRQERMAEEGGTPHHQLTTNTGDSLDIDEIVMKNTRMSGSSNVGISGLGIVYASPATPKGGKTGARTPPPQGLRPSPSPTPPSAQRPPSAGPQTASSNSCLRRFVRRWNDPMRGSNGSDRSAVSNSTQSVTRSGNADSLDVENIRSVVAGTVRIEDSGDQVMIESVSGDTEPISPVHSRPSPSPPPAPPSHASPAGRHSAPRGSNGAFRHFVNIFVASTESN